MLSQFNLYIIIGLILALVATSGGFLLYRRITLVEIAVLEQRNATLTLAVDQQTKTIEQMVQNAERLAAANKFLSERFAATQTEIVMGLTSTISTDFYSGSVTSSFSGP